MPRSAGTAPRTTPTTAPTRRRNHYERRLQIFLVRQFRKLVDPLEASLIAIENGEDRSPETLGLLGAMGIEPGACDLALVMIGRRIHWIECKLEATLTHARTDLRDDQRAHHSLMRWYGHAISVVRNAAEFWAIVDGYGISHAPVVVRPEQLVLPRPRRKPAKRLAPEPAPKPACVPR